MALMMRDCTSPSYPLERVGSRRRLLTSTATPTNASRTITDSSFSNYGLLITLDDDNRLCLQFCPDHNLRHIHPNSYAPAAFENVHKLSGGGSGVAVFGGRHPALGQVVMKHGGDKDLTELFALGTVAHELDVRSQAHPSAARHIQYRIPAFRMIYLSPHHLGEKRKVLWKRLREISRINCTMVLLPVDEQQPQVTFDDEPHDESVRHSSPTSWRSFNNHPEQQQQHQHHSNRTLLPEVDEDDDFVEAEESFKMLKNCRILDQCRDQTHLPSGFEISQSGTVSGHREIAIVVAPSHHRPCEVKLKGESLLFVLPEGQYDSEEVSCRSGSGSGSSSHTRRIRLHGDGYQALQMIYQDLLSLMKGHKWKFTLGQKLIGGESPQTGNEWLYNSRLNGDILNNLIQQNVKMVQDLVRLTTLEEQDPKVLDDIRQEVKRIRQKGKLAEAGDLSLEADTFVGSAVRKNFRSGSGRLPMLLKLGKHFKDHFQQPSKPFFPNKYNLQRHDSLSFLVLTPEEKIPARHLGLITQPGALMGSTFEKAPMEPTILEAMGTHYWQTLLSKAVEEEAPHNTTMVWKRLWTCGLTDAGIHNLFCSKDRLWLFDLGEPQLTSVPGFLTKFLFSFFHTLGMQEPAGDSTTWVRRFDHHKRTDKLRLTSATSRLLSHAYAAFANSLDRTVEELFKGDDSVRWLLLQYVTLQLVSDASFCLQKWTIKGGGRARDSNHQEGLEKWLWRALWDIYVACDINDSKSLQRLKVRAPEGHEVKIVSQTLRQRQMALIQELSLEAVSHHSDDLRHSKSAKVLQPVTYANAPRAASD